MRIILTVGAMLATALLIISTSKNPVTGRPELRTDHQLCLEVEEELRTQVALGMITEEQAGQVADRCFRTFTPGGN